MYLLNAHTDAYLANKLIAYYKSQDINSVKSKRAKKLIKAADNNLKMILGIAYCQYYWNGWYDYICAKIFEIFVKKDDNLEKYKKELKVSCAYEEISLDIFTLIYALFYPLVFLVLGRMANKNAFIKKFNLNKKDVKKKYLIRACFLTQIENIKNNRYQIKEIYNNKTKKAQCINNFVEQFSDKEPLISAIKRTLRMANIWDAMFASFLRLRYSPYFFIHRAKKYAKIIQKEVN